jgi:hypothetical protein
VSFPDFSFDDGSSIYGFTTPNDLPNQPTQIRVNGFSLPGWRQTWHIKQYDTAESVTLLPNTYYVMKYGVTGEDPQEPLSWLIMGEQTPTYTAQDTNPDSPFYINGTAGVIRKVLSGGEYDNIYTTLQAQERAEWELYNYTNMKNSVTLTCAPIYYADVNTLVSYTTQYDDVTANYIIKSISTDLSVDGSQTINMIKYFPYYIN